MDLPVQQNAAAATDSSARLRSALTKETAERDALFLQLGRDCYEQNKTVADSPFADTCLLLRVCLQRIEKLENELGSHRIGSVKCPVCHLQLPAHALFCSSCGNRLQPQEPATPKKTVPCPYCAAPQPEGLLFCTACGAPLTGQKIKEAPPTINRTPAQPAAPVAPPPQAPVKPQPAPATPPAAPVAPAQPAPPKKRVDPFELTLPAQPAAEKPAPPRARAAFCKKCGTVLTEEATVCPSCGAKR